MDQQTIIVIAVGLVALVAAAIFIALQMAARRRAALSSAALGLGLEFVPEKTAPPDDLSGLGVLSRGHAHSLRNVLRGQRGDTQVLLADHYYVTGAGKNRRQHRTALAVLRRSGVALPHFYLRPQLTLIDRIGKMLGGKDIDFTEDSDFSRAFVLQGEDEGAVRALFGPAARHQALQLGKGIRAEGRRDVVLIERTRRVDAPQVPLLLDAATALLDVLAGGARSSW